VGRAATAALEAAGWDVLVASRHGPVRVDRSHPGELEAAVGDGVDVLVDVVAFTAADGEQLNALMDRVGSLVVISSASVYIDDDGRTLDEASSLETFPRLPTPVRETQPTVAPGDASYSTRKVALERTVLEGPIPATVVRPCAIHGPESQAPREWFFVKRVRDGRTHVVLVSKGESRFHTTSAVNLAHLIRLVAECPSDRILNCGDPSPPTVAEIGAAVAPELEQVPVPENGYERDDLANPWAVPVPLILDMRRANIAVGYRPVAGYREAVKRTREWLLETERDFAETYLARYFDYEAEDKVVESRA
jgi:nucleoside-diphosphate-sugar epimerase